MYADAPLDVARAALAAARATPRRQAVVSQALDALERLIRELEQARTPRPVPLVSPMTPVAHRLDLIPRQEHVKRALEVALIGQHPVTLIAAGDPADAHTLAGWLNAYAPGLAQVIRPCPCGNFGHPALACACDDAAITAHRESLPVAAARLADLVVAVPPPGMVSLRLGEPDEQVLERVAAARLRTVAEERVTADGGTAIVQLRDGGAQSLLTAAMRQMPMLSGVRVRQLVAVAASIARLSAAAQISASHLAEAVQYVPRQPGED